MTSSDYVCAYLSIGNWLIVKLCYGKCGVLCWSVSIVLLSVMKRGYLLTEVGQERLKEGGMEGAYLGEDGRVHVPGKRTTLYSKPAPPQHKVCHTQTYTRSFGVRRLGSGCYILMLWMTVWLAFCACSVSGRSCSQSRQRTIVRKCRFLEHSRQQPLWFLYSWIISLRFFLSSAITSFLLYMNYMVH